MNWKRKSATTIPRGASRFVLLAGMLLLNGCLDGQDPVAPRVQPIEPSPLLVPQVGFVQLATSGRHGCALKADATVVCWGGDSHGQTIVPAGLDDATQVTTGRFHTCALRTDGTVRCWGNTHGGVPAGLSDVVEVSSGGNHSCGIKSDGTVACWGFADHGALAVPAGLSDVTQVSAGAGDHTCALKSDATVVCWGDSGWDATNPPAGLSSVAQVSAGGLHTCALQADATVVCWGDDRLGGASPPADLTDVIQVSAGWLRTCALKGDGTVVCWGADAPAIPASLTDVVELGTGADARGVCVLRSDTTIVCFDEPAPPAPHVYPTATFTATPSSVVTGAPFTLALVDAQVPGHPEATAFTFAFDCGDGYGAFGTSDTVSCATSEVGTLGVAAKVRDQDGDETAYTGTVRVGYDFVGFSAPVSNVTSNVAKAGRTIPLKWRLLDADGAPVTHLTSAALTTADLTPCDLGTTRDAGVETSGGTGLQNLGDGYYQFNWKTPKSYANSCKTMHLDLGEGITHAADFEFTR